jgi:two-component system KDP operon response regulator KdpE
VTRDKKRVLICDDHPKVINFIRLGLKFKGFDVVSAGSGEECLKVLKTNNIDILLQDIKMPGMNGFDVMIELRKFSSVPVIAYSATIEYAEQAMKSGANTFIPKPLDIHKLVTMINGLV